jgi:hypothetical protein
MDLAREFAQCYGRFPRTETLLRQRRLSVLSPCCGSYRRPCRWAPRITPASWRGGCIHILRTYEGLDVSDLMTMSPDLQARASAAKSPSCWPCRRSRTTVVIFLMAKSRSICVTRTGATRLTGVIPYFGYARQERRIDRRSLGARVAPLIATAIRGNPFDESLADLRART